MNSLAKKVTFLQVIIISLSMLGFILYISSYLGSYIERETEKKIESEISHLTQTVTVYNGAIEDTAVKLFSMFEAGFGTFFVNPDEKIKVNGVDTPLITSGGFTINNNFAKVESFTDLSGAVATVFARSGDDFVRVSTSLKKEDGSRAMGTFLGKSSPAYDFIMKKQRYVGNARLFGKDYVTVYAPIIENDQILGILFIGYDFTQGLKTLKTEMNKMTLGKNGYFYAINTKSQMYDVHPKQGEVKINSEIDKKILGQKNGLLHVTEDGFEKIVNFKEFPKWNWIIVSKANEQDFQEANDTLRNALIYFSLIITIVMLIIMWFTIHQIITKPLHNLIEKAQELSSGDGDLTRKLAIRGNDEIARASEQINHFIEKVRLLICNAKSLSSENSSISHELSTTSLHVESLVEKSTTIVHDTTHKATQMREVLVSSIQEAKDAKEDMSKANVSLNSARKAIIDLTTDIQKSSTVEIELAHKIHQLSSDA